ncbi:MAG: hypothetical protein ACI84E_000551 [Planctomycetota bacterium]|jgi:uncharacterized protein (DUF1800 family)
MQNLILPTLLLTLTCPALAQEMTAPAPVVQEAQAFVWNARTAEHLINRAGFGARPDEIDAAVAMGLEAYVDSLFLAKAQQVPLASADRLSTKDGLKADERERMKEIGGKEMASEEMLDAVNDEKRSMQRSNNQQLDDYTIWWFDTMIGGEDPLRDRMTLFWHGLLTSSMRDVKSSYQMIEQNHLLRNGALGDYKSLLIGIAKDPAMLEYLDNDENKKDAPNENFAREVMELFTLGEGHYTEEDIREAARAFTGWRSRGAEYSYSNRQHDKGKKTFMGVTGRHKGEDILNILLEQEQCGDYIAGRIVSYLEGAAPSVERQDAYGQLLFESDYDIEVLLRALFVDPAFYRDEVVGNRVAGPVDFLVGSARRLELLPPAAWLLSGSQVLGQRLFHPPSVKGWDGGMAWITTASLMQRGNLAGILVGQVDPRDVVSREVEDGDMGEMGEMGDMAEMDSDTDKKVRKSKLGDLGGLKKIRGKWAPTLGLNRELGRATTSAEIVDGLLDLLLAVEAGDDTRSYLVGEYETKSREAGLDGRGMRNRREREDVLAAMAHLILSLPEAQLN